ncbi:hypothetical protein QUB63_03350 [Microcoleus sp. ARI1-B5]|uniref:hypothetical protein n=1 Tax=unclassified Microcoleus TaxID=2642155 RepID=UPI002FD12FE5
MSRVAAEAKVSQFAKWHSRKPVKRSYRPLESPEYYFRQRRSGEQKRRQRDCQLYTWYVGEFQYSFCGKISCYRTFVPTGRFC